MIYAAKTIAYKIHLNNILHDKNQLYRILLVHPTSNRHHKQVDTFNIDF